MSNIRRKAVATLMVGVLITSACSSGGEGAAEVEAAQAVSDEVTTSASTTSEAPATTTTPSEPESDESPDTTIVIEAEVTFGQTSATGTWDVIEGAETLGCDGGTLSEFGAEDAVAQELTCTGTRSGAFVGRFAPTESGTTFTSSWEVIVASGDFVDMSGLGDWTAQITPAGDGATFTLELDVAFGEVAAPGSTLLRLAQPQETPCWDGFVAADGLTEYATVDDTMLSLDLATGAKTDHGPAPSECAWWLGDSEQGIRMALSLPDGPAALPDGEQKVWLGALDGPWDVELTYDEPTLLLSRSMTANRLLFFQPDSGSVFMIDATSGEKVGSDFVGNFAEGRHSVATASSKDGRFIALGGATVTGGDGQLFLLDAETGDEVARIDTVAPTTALAFDADGDELVLGLFTGEVVTVDTASFEVVAEVGIDSTTAITALGIRPDGLVVVSTSSAAMVIDRLTGPTGQSISLRHSGAARIRPDGTLNSTTNIQRFEVYEIAA